MPVERENLIRFLKIKSKACGQNFVLDASNVRLRFLSKSQYGSAADFALWRFYIISYINICDLLRPKG